MISFKYHTQKLLCANTTKLYKNTKGGTSKQNVHVMVISEQWLLTQTSNSKGSQAFLSNRSIGGPGNKCNTVQAWEAEQLTGTKENLIWIFSNLHPLGHFWQLPQLPQVSEAHCTERTLHSHRWSTEHITPLSTETTTLTSWISHKWHHLPPSGWSLCHCYVKLSLQFIWDVSTVPLNF